MNLRLLLRLLLLNPRILLHLLMILVRLLLLLLLHDPHAAQRGAEDRLNPLRTSLVQSGFLHRRDQDSIDKVLGSARVIRQVHPGIMHLSRSRVIVRTLLKRCRVVDLHLSAQHRIENGFSTEPE